MDLKNAIITCRYCGQQDMKSIKSSQDVKNLRCSCGETKNFVIEEFENTDIFGYRFSPPFEEDIEDPEDNRGNFGQEYYF